MDQNSTGNIFSEILNPHAPPQEYAVPVAETFIAVPPAIGSQFTGWLSISRTWSRSNIAAWSAAANATRVSLSLAVALILSTLGSLLTGVATLATGGRGALFGSPHTVMVSAIASIMLSPLAFLGGVFLMAYTLTFFMHSSLGTRNARFHRVLAPLALAFVPVSAATFFRSLAQSGITYFLPAPSSTNFTLSFGSLQCVNGLVAIATIGYSLVLLVQSGSVGSSLSRIIVGVLLGVAVIVAGGLFSLLTFGIGFL